MMITTQAYYVPSIMICLLSPQDYFCQLHKGYAIINPKNMQLFWSPEQTLTVPFDVSNNLPVIKAIRRKEQQKQCKC